MVEKSGNKYTLTMDATDMVSLVNSFLTYTIQNFEQVATYLKEFANGLSSEEMAMLGLEPYMLEEFNAAMDEAIADVAVNGPQYLEETTAEIDSEMQDEFLAMIKGSRLVTSTEKKKDGSYESVVNMDLAIREPGQPKNVVNIVVKGQNSIKPTKPFTVTLPTSGVVSFQDVVAKLQKQTLVVYVKENYYIHDTGQNSSDGNIAVKMFSGSTYLPMRQIAEAFGEQVNWDSAAQKAYVERDRQKVYVTGKVIQGKTYIKIRDFEKLGYKVNWDGATQAVTIIK